MYEYFHRIVDELLQEKLDAMAVLVEGPKYCGKKPLPFNVQAVSCT